MTVRTRATLNTNADNTVEDNSGGSVTPADVRAMLKDVIDSYEHAEEHLWRLLDADVAHTNGTAAQQWFPSTGAVTIPLTGTYFFEGSLRLAHGTTGHTTSTLFAGTATRTFVEYWSVHHTAAANTLSATQNTKWSSADTAQVVTPAAGSNNLAEEWLFVRGIIRFSAIGTLIPQFQYSVAPGTTTTTKRGTHFSLRYLGTTTFVSRGTWA